MAGAGLAAGHTHITSQARAGHAGCSLQVCKHAFRMPHDSRRGLSLCAGRVDRLNPTRAAQLHQATMHSCMHRSSFGADTGHAHKQRQCRACRSAAHPAASTVSSLAALRHGSAVQHTAASKPVTQTSSPNQLPTPQADAQQVHASQNLSLSVAVQQMCCPLTVAVLLNCRTAVQAGRRAGQFLEASRSTHGGDCGCTSSATSLPVMCALIRSSGRCLTDMFEPQTSWCAHDSTICCCKGSPCMQAQADMPRSRHMSCHSHLVQRVHGMQLLPYFAPCM